MSFSTVLADAALIGLYLLVIGAAVIILWKMATGKIDLSTLLSESDGKASMSRFQFLIFTFVIAGVWLLLSIQTSTLLVVPDSVLWLLGISGGSYGASKAIQTWGNSTPSGGSQNPVVPAGGAGPAAGGGAGGAD